MPSAHANRNQSNYRKLVVETLRRIPANSPEWTNHNTHDPGVTLIQVLAYSMEDLLDRLDKIPASSHTRFRKVAARVRRRRRSLRLLVSGGNKQTRAAVARARTTASEVGGKSRSSRARERRGFGEGASIAGGFGSSEAEFQLRS